MMKRTLPPTPAQQMEPHRPARCYHRIVREVAGNRREIGVLLLVLAVVLVPGLLTAGCYYPAPTFAPPMRCDPGNDATCPSGMTCSAQGVCDGTDAGVDGSDADTCFGTEPFSVCLVAAPTLSLRTSELGTTIDTTPDPTAKCVATRRPADSHVCVLAATNITVDATLRATGSRPLVLIASETITIEAGGVIDVGSHRGATPELGAGADSKDCVSGQTTIQRGGGAGGSFLGLGGTGGPGFFTTDKAGTPGPVAAANELRGGCVGQDTFLDPATTTPAVRGGHGGGAVLLIAGQSISVASGGAIKATGEGGEGGSVSASQVGGGGGGGGGSGGMIVLDARRMIMSQGLILASGGGGGGGASFGSSSPGNPGVDPSEAAAAAGGPGSPDGGGRGGAGSSAAMAAGGVNGSNGTSNGGNGRGGGGGGGAGIVKAFGMATLGSQVSPTPTP